MSLSRGDSLSDLTSPVGGALAERRFAFCRGSPLVRRVLVLLRARGVGEVGFVFELLMVLEGFPWEVAERVNALTVGFIFWRRYWCQIYSHQISNVSGSALYSFWS